MIPKIIWQTYEVPFDELPEYAKECIKTWKDSNPEWQYRYMDAKERDKFVLENFDSDWYDIFINLRHGVLKADIWRHMVMFKYGGVYADVDTLCKGPISLWLKNEMNTTYFIDDDNVFFCQFVLSSTPNNNIYKYILDSIKNKLKDKNVIYKLNKNVKNFEQMIVGSAICTEAIKNFLNIPKEFDLIKNYKEIVNFESLLKNKFFYYGKESYEMLHNYPIKHLMASLNWNKGDYIQWQK